jgi:parvulin-like peptidyl-prolyl isomerase
MNQDLNRGKMNFLGRLKVRLINFFDKISFWRRKEKITALARTKENPQKNWRIFLLVAIVVILFAFFVTSIIFAIGMYRYGWEGRATKLAMKILPYPAAIVGLDTVTMNDFYGELGYVQHFYDKTGQAAPESSVLKKQILDQLIERKILQRQAQRYNVAVSAQEVNDEFQKIADENGGVDEVTKILNELYGLSINKFKELISVQLLKEKLRDEIPVQMKAKHILIKWTKKDGAKKKKEALAKIRKLRKLIVDGKTTFEKMAKKYSNDTATKNMAGDLGWVQRGQMVEEFEKSLFTLKKDGISGVVLTKFGYHIIKVEDIKGKVDKSFADWIEDITQNTKIWKLVK